MYCPNCGNQIDGHNFCPNCGAPSATTAVTTAPNNDRLQQRKSELQLMDHMIEYFSQKQEAYIEYDSISEAIYKLGRGVTKAPLVFGIILIAVSAISLFSLVLDNIFNLFSIFTLFFAGFGVAGGVLMSLFFKKRKTNRQLLLEYTDRYYELGSELYEHYCNYENCPIGHEYTNPSNLEVIKQTIISGRADNTKDAINVLVEDAHRAKMVDIATQTAMYAQQTAEYAQQTAENTRRTAKNTRTAAVFTAAHFFRHF